MSQIQYPDFDPWARRPQDYNWIIIKVLNPPKQRSYGRGKKVIDTAAQGTEYKFLAPRSLNFSISHEWANYENITSRLANVIANYAVPYSDLTSGASQFMKSIQSLMSGGGLTAKSAGAVEGIIDKATTDVINYRVDTAQVYKSSEFLSYIFEFDFGVHGGSTTSSPQHMWSIIQDIMKFSSPKKQGDGILIDPPHIFTIQSWPSNWLYIQYASIRNIQNDISETQYIGGYPTNYKSTITFTDITPLFDSSFVDSPGSRVTTGIMGGGAAEVVEGFFTSLMPGRR